jgi:Ca-activated chloride channel family protein
MTFAAPLALWLLLLVPVMVAGYVLAQRRRARYAVRFTNTDLLAGLVTESPRWRRHVPAAIYLAALAALLASLAHPEATVLVPKEQATVVLVMDVSRSMLARDVEPTRMEAAKTAAKSFVEKVPDQFKLGVVSFSGTAQAVTLPTTDRRLVNAGLDSLIPIGSTAIGDGIREGLAVGRRAAEAGAGNGQPDGPTGPNPGQEPQGQGEEHPLVLLLISDGKNEDGVAPEVAAQEAREQGVSVFTVALGTPNGLLMEERRGIVTMRPVPPDELTLAQIANTTNGRFFRAPSSQDLQAVYDELGSRIGFEREQRDITAWFAAAGAVLLLAGGLLALRWFNRLP